MNENCFPKLGKIGPKQFQNPGLSLRGKTEHKIEAQPNEEKNKNTNTNVHIGSLVLTFCSTLKVKLGASRFRLVFPFRDQIVNPENPGES